MQRLFFLGKTRVLGTHSSCGLHTRRLEVAAPPPAPAEAAPQPPEPESALPPDEPEAAEAVEENLDLEAVLEQCDDPVIPMSAADKKRAHNKYVYWWQKKTGYRAANFRRQSAIGKHYTLKDLAYEDRKDRLTKFALENPDLTEPAARMLIGGRTPGDNGSERVRSAVWTWHGDWGLLSGAQAAGQGERPELAGESALPLDVQQEQEGGSHPSALPDPTRVAGEAPAVLTLADFCFEKSMKDVQARAAALRPEPRVLALWTDLEAWAKAFRERHPQCFMAWSLELCERSGTEETRIHAHAYVSFYNQRQQRVAESATRFRGALPFQVGGMTCLLRSGRNHFAGMYYILMPKASKIFSSGTHEAHKDFSVTGTWIFGHLEAGKMTIGNATAELRKVPNGITRNLQYVGDCAKARQEEAMERYLAYRAANTSEVKNHGDASP